MKDILDCIKSYIESEKIDENVLIRNISTLESFTVEDLKKKVLAGEFKEQPKS